MKKASDIILAFLPPLLLLCILSTVYLLPRHEKLVEASISPLLPLGYELPGWYGHRLQESEEERTTLAADTRFSKASYTKLRQSLSEARGPEIIASIVFSGNDMNASIHRPERCLPAQGHVDLHSESHHLQLKDGYTMKFTRLTSRTPSSSAGNPGLQHINYYIFVGHETIQSNHIARTLRDMYDRVMHGYVQRWAYYQIGTYWGGSTGISEEQADARLQALIAELTPNILNWRRLEN